MSAGWRSGMRWVGRGCTTGLMILLVSGCRVAAPRADDSTFGNSGYLVIRGVTVIDGTGAASRDRISVVIRGTRIESVAPDSATAVPVGASVIDADGQFLIPGLWDLHVHLAKAGGHVLPLFLAYGVTGVRDMGGDARMVGELREAVAASRRPGPRIRMAGPILESDAYMASAVERRVIEPVERFRAAVGVPERAQVVVDSVAALGADFVKFRTIDSLPVYRAIARAARAAGLDLVGHAQNLPAEEVLRAGQRSVEHALYPFLSQRDSTDAVRLARAFAASATAFVPTLVTFTRSIFTRPDRLAAVLADTAGRIEPLRPYMAGFLVRDWAEQLEERIEAETSGDTLPWGQIHRLQLADLELLHAAGAPILPGTDLGVLNVFPGAALHDELALLVDRVGLSPMEALEAATRRAAELVGLGTEVGTIQPGMVADLVLLEGDPLADIRNTRRITAVVRNGVHYPAEALDSLRGTVFTAAAAIRDGRSPGPPLSSADSAPSGVYELRALVNGQRIPIRLQLIAVDGAPWGRLSVGPDAGITAAMQGLRRTDATWTFAAGGPVRTVVLTFSDSVSGWMRVGDGPTIALHGRRTGGLADPEALRAHHVLAPLGLPAGTGREGASFPAITAVDQLLFAAHGADLSHQTLMVAQRVGDGWAAPRVLSISGQYSDRSPAVSPDGSVLIFASDRPGPGGAGADGYRLWISDATEGGGWGPARLAEFAGRWDRDARQPSLAGAGTLHFSSTAPDGRDGADIYAASPLRPGRWSAPRNLGPPVNGPGEEVGVFVAPDQSYMILTSSGDRPGAAGGDDLYVSRRTHDGWSAPVALNLPVNTFANEYGAWVSAIDGQLYFTSDRYGYARIFRTDARTAGVPVR